MDTSTTPEGIAQAILGPAAGSHLGVINRVVENLPDTRYVHIPPDEWLGLVKTDPAEGLRIYWTEILYRAHFCACVSLVRTKRWLDALIAMAWASNYLGFMASYRGFLESSADSYYSLGKVCFWLADFHVAIRAAIKGNLDHPMVFPDIENALNHFAHARRLEGTDTGPDEHRARTIREYIESMAQSDDRRVAACYRALCDATHPATGSLLCYVHAAPRSDSDGFGVTTLQDRDWIASFGRDYQDVSTRLMFFGAVPPLMILRTLNECGVANVRTKVADSIGTEKHPLWADIASRLADPRPPEERL